jgi:hypothetical protein
MESLGFVWRYLPWVRLSARDQKQKHARVCEVKSRVSFEELFCGFPAQLVRYFHAVKGFRVREKPNSAEIKLMFREGYVCEYKCDGERPVRPAPTAPIGRPSISADDYFAVKAQKEVYSVLGNDKYCRMANIIGEPEKFGVGLLRNESVL